jgi:hypothetical protein
VAEKIEQAGARLRADEAPEMFMAEMSRFVTPSLVARLSRDRPFATAWLNHAQVLLERMRTELVADDEGSELTQKGRG